MKISKNLWKLIAFVVVSLVLWFVGTDLHAKMTPLEAYAGMAAIAGIFQVLWTWGEKILSESKPKQ